MSWAQPPDLAPANVVEQFAADILALYTQAEARLLGDVARRVRTDHAVAEWAVEKAAAARELRPAAERIATQVARHRIPSLSCRLLHNDCRPGLDGTGSNGSRRGSSGRTTPSGEPASRSLPGWRVGK